MLLNEYTYITFNTPNDTLFEGERILYEWKSLIAPRSLGKKRWSTIAEYHRRASFIVCCIYLPLAIAMLLVVLFTLERERANEVRLFGLTVACYVISMHRQLFSHVGFLVYVCMCVLQSLILGYHSSSSAGSPYWGEGWDSCVLFVHKESFSLSPLFFPYVYERSFGRKAYFLCSALIVFCLHSASLHQAPYLICLSRRTQTHTYKFRDISVMCLCVCVSEKVELRSWKKFLVENEWEKREKRE